MDADGDDEDDEENMDNNFNVDGITQIVDAITNIEVFPPAPSVTPVPLTPNNKPADQQPLMGSSQTSGGFSHGH